MITGLINSNTPLCVLQDIADAHGIDYNFLDLNEGFYKYVLEMGPPDTKEFNWGILARFINKNCSWTQKPLLLALNHLKLFMNSDRALSKLSSQYCIGNQTPENPFSINSNILYKICIQENIPTKFTDTQEDLELYIKIYRQSKQTIINLLLKQFDGMNNGELLRMMINMIPEYLNKGKIEEEINFSRGDEDIQDLQEYKSSSDLLRVMFYNLNDVKVLQKNVVPNTTHGAIALAAINYKLDISRCENPVMEYSNILSNEKEDEFMPMDRWMKFWYNKNRDMFNLEKNFNPIFPSQFYDDSVLRKMAKDMGFTEVEIQNEHPYSLLETAYLSETFYRGHYPCMKDRQTIINLDNVNDIENDEIICYGQINDRLWVTTIEELKSVFEFHNNFVNPFKNDSIFGKREMERLKNILGERVDMIQLINKIEKVFGSYDDKTKKFLYTYKTSCNSIKNKIRLALNLLVECGMYMRGWKGKGYTYPLSEHDTLMGPDSVEIIDYNVNKSISAYEYSITELMEIGVQINELPLYKTVDNKYYKSTLKEQCFTIGERMELIKMGNRTNNVSSCIRLSSNWICASAHRYITILGFEEPFDLKLLKSIA